MRTKTIFAVGLTAALLLVVVMSLPASAQSTYGNGFTLLSSTSGLSGPNSPTIMPVKGGGGHHGGFRGGLGFYGGGYGYGPYRYGYGSSYGDGYGYYQEGNNTCVWNGYNYRCFNTNQGFY